MLPVVAIEGRVVEDPELRFAPSGVAVGRLRLVASSRKKVNEEWVDDKTLWIDVTTFRQLAENVAESVRKGDLVVATGKLQTEEWEKDGQKRSKIALVADNVALSAMFRAIPRGEQTQRVKASDSPAESDPWSTPPGSDEPPF